MSSVRFLDPEAARRRARTLRKQYLRDGWTYAKTGPLPMALFLVGAWRRLTHKAHPSYLLQTALEAAQGSAERWTLELSENHPEATRSVRLRLLLWLTGSQDTEAEGPEEVADFRVASPTSPLAAPEEVTAIPWPSASLAPAAAATLQPPHDDQATRLQLPAHPPREATETGTQSHASSAPIGPDSSSSPVTAASGNPTPIDNEPATPAAPTHRLSETPE